LNTVSTTLEGFLLTSMVLDYGLYKFKALYEVLRLGYVSPYNSPEVRKSLNRFVERLPERIAALVAPEYCLPLSKLRFFVHTDDLWVKYDDGKLVLVPRKGEGEEVISVRAVRIQSTSKLHFKTVKGVYTLQVNLPAADFKVAEAPALEVFSPIINPLYQTITMAEEEQRAIPIGGYNDFSKKEEGAGKRNTHKFMAGTDTAELEQVVQGEPLR